MIQMGKGWERDMKIVILERGSVGDDVSVDCLKDLGETVIYHNTVAGEVEERVKEADIIIANKAPLNRETLKDAASLKMICEFATGFDNVDLEYCREKGIRVANVVDYSTAAVAQHTFALCFYVLRKAFSCHGSKTIVLHMQPPGRSSPHFHQTAAQIHRTSPRLLRHPLLPWRLPPKNNDCG